MKKTLGLSDLIMMNVAAIVGLRWIPMAAGYGPAAVALWLLAAALFFVPTGLVAAELATAWPDQGGVYAWVRRAFGQKWGFLTAWFYWVNNLFYYPSLLTYVAVTLAFLIDPELAKNKLYVCATILVVFWGVTLFNLRGLQIGKWLINAAAVLGTVVPGGLLIGLGVLSVALWQRPAATEYSLAAMVPSLSGFENISLLSALMFAMAGIEVTPIMAEETEDPPRTFPRATLWSALLIALLYIVGTVAVTLMAPPEKIGSASGIMDAVQLLAADLGLPWLVPAMVVLLTIGNFGGISVWVIGPIKMLFESCKEGILPPALTRLNAFDMPGNAMLVQAGFITVVTVAISFLPTVNAFYEALVMMCTITYFIPYVFLFVAFLALRRRYPDVPRPCRVPGGTIGAWTVGLTGLASVLLAIILPFFPGKDLTTPGDVLIYELQIGGGPLLFGALGLFLFARRPPEATSSV